MSHILPTYARYDVTFVRGEGAYLYADDGSKYLDFAAGIAVNALGHCHPVLVNALQTQASTLWHTSNLYHIDGMETFAADLCKRSMADYVFFTNSGAESLECTIKTMRKYHHANNNAYKNRIITFHNSFHGRSMAGISAAGQKKLLHGFTPAMEAMFDHVPFGDIDAVKSAITENTAGILLEPIQGEGGINVAENSFLQALRALCDAYDLLLGFDEVQCGMLRTGSLFYYEQTGVQPDIIALAKGLGGGFPLGAVLVTKEAGKGMTPGTHGSTYGGNPLGIKVGHAVLQELSTPALKKHVQEVSAYLQQGLRVLQQQYADKIIEIRGKGLMLGLKLNDALVAGDMVNALRAQKLLTVAAGDNVVRILPPLIVTKAECDIALECLHHVFLQGSDDAL